MAIISPETENKNVFLYLHMQNYIYIVNNTIIQEKTLGPATLSIFTNRN